MWKRRVIDGGEHTELVVRVSGSLCYRCASSKIAELHRRLGKRRSSLRR
jgi:hypothetical protein